MTMITVDLIPEMMSKYIIFTSRAKMPGSCFNGNHYRHVYVAELDMQEVVRRIAKGIFHYPKIAAPAGTACIKKYVFVATNLFEGSTNHCAFEKAHDKALSLVRALDALN